MFCPRCGSSNPQEATICANCGFNLTEAAEKLSQRPPAGPVSHRVIPSNSPKLGTMMGVAVPAQGSQAPPTGSPQQAAKHGTMMGVAVPAAGSSRPPPPAPAAKHGTMVGAAVPAQGSHAPPVVPHQAPPAGKHATMMGVAVPSQGSHAPPTAPPQPGQAGQPGPAAAHQRPKHATMAGVAVPAQGSHRPPAPQNNAAQLLGNMPITRVPAATPPATNLAVSEDRPCETPRMALIRAIQTQGVAATQDLEALDGFLTQGPRPNATHLLRAVQAGVVAILQDPSSPPAARMLQATQALISSFNMQPADARYAVDSWALALGLVQQNPS